MLDSEDRCDLAAGLVALLDLIERPALAITSDGVLLGANQDFLEWLASTGISGAGELRSFLTEGSVSHVLSGSREPGARELDLAFRDGVIRTTRVETTRLASGELAQLLVFQKIPQLGGGLRSASTLRHDLAGPLTAILGTAELMLMRGQQLPREVRDNLGQILENCGRMSEILAKCRVQERD